jgi:hypothetical protein
MGAMNVAKTITRSARRTLKTDLSIRLLFAVSVVDDFETVRASMFNSNQQLSTRSVQQVQYQSLTNHRFQQIFITC